MQIYKHRQTPLAIPQAAKTTTRIALGETGVSRHQGGTIEGPPETPRTSHHYRIEGFKGVPKGNENIGFSV